MKATDKEDGDITDKLVFTGSVNTLEVESYEIYYKVKDSGGLDVTKKITITVKKVLEPTGETYSSTEIYLKERSVVYNGGLYKAKWWTQEETPGKANVWKKDKCKLRS
ncbi:immunoglobulin-like domain-containing protein [Clostridium gasigenes]|uniref:immunoglobulin-like domain-containing protein n=1 Tax=Clostridium gasigenes TaxID=94869 RepID=UPI003395EB2D